MYEPVAYSGCVAGLYSENIIEVQRRELALVEVVEFLSGPEEDFFLRPEEWVVGDTESPAIFR
jgi:hypothetical protein